MAVLPGNLVVAAVLVTLLAAATVWVVRLYGVARVVRRNLAALRVDGPALAVGAVVLVGAAGVLAYLADGSLPVRSAPLRSAAVAVLLVAGAGALTVAVANLDWYRALRSVPVSSPADVDPGPVLVEGVVSETDVLVESPVTGTDCVAYGAASLEERAVLGRGYAHSVWVPAASVDAATDFSVIAAAGRASDDVGETTGAADGEASQSAASERGVSAPILVDGAAAEFPLLHPAPVLRYTRGGQALKGRTRSVSVEPGMSAPIGDALGRGTRSRPRQHVERRLDTGDLVTVLGTAEPVEDGGLRVVDDPDGPPLVVAACDAETVRSHVRALVLRWGGTGLASLLGAAWLVRPLLG